MITVHFEGGAELMRNLEALSMPVSRRLIRDALREGAEPMRKRMAQLAPYDPDPPGGRVHLRTKMAIGLSTQGRDELAVAIGPTKRGGYGSFQELGTSRHPAQPFARPAFDQVWPDSLKIFAAALWRELAGRRISRVANAPTRVIPGPGGRIGASGRRLSPPRVGIGEGQFV